MDLLNYALGAVITEWTDEELSCDFVIAEVRLNSVDICLKREIAESGQAKMLIFEGTMKAALESQTEWYQYPMRRSADKHSYSQQIFELLGLPRHKTDDEKNLTLHQILRLIYVDQLSSTTKLLKEDINFDNVTFRRAIGEYLLGIDDLEAHNLRQELIAANKEFEKFNGELNAIYKMFGHDASLINDLVLTNEIRGIEQELKELHEKKDKILASGREELDEASKQKAEILYNKIKEFTLNKQLLDTEKSEKSTELIDTKLFLYSIKERKAALDNSKHTHLALGGVRFKYCPACLEPISESDHQGCCSLCKAGSNHAEKDYSYVQMLNELNFQIKESILLIEDFERRIDEINSQLPSVTRKLESSKSEYEELVSTANSKDAMLAEVSIEIGFCKSQLITYEDRRELVNKVEKLRLHKESANKRILKIEESLDLVSKRQEDRYSYVYDSIERIAKRLLSQDGGYELTFNEAEDVIFDFAKDKMYVNGKNKFSASSMVVMKNGIRLAIFLHAVDDYYCRLPNILLMDNIEDKGMEAERSQNFQHVIINECEKLKNEYQLIFSTSMIAPDLNNTSMCIGPMYMKGSHTLEFQ